MSVKFGIIGPGRVAVRFCEAVKMVSGAKVAAVASTSRERAESFAKSHGIAQSYGSYEQMLSLPEIDVVYIATTHNFHYENIMLCLKYGKGVLCEKSMVTNAAHAKEVFEYAQKHKLFLMEAMWVRYLPAVKKAKEWIDSGRIGRPILASAILGFRAKDDAKDRFLNKELGGGAAYDLSVYNIELATYLFGDAYKSVTAHAVFGETGVDITNNISLHYKDFSVSLLSTLAANLPRSDMYIYASRGSILLERLAGISKCTLYTDEGSAEVFEGKFENGFQYEIRDVCDCIKNGRTVSDTVPPEVTVKCAEIYDIMFG
ncbi:MAG: Gfo/Idh/MocA family protein [Acutalibacteraceae bacterium]